MPSYVYQFTSRKVLKFLAKALAILVVLIFAWYQWFNLGGESVVLFTGEAWIPRVITTEFELYNPKKGHRDWILHSGTYDPQSEGSVPDYRITLENLGETVLWVIDSYANTTEEMELHPRESRNYSSAEPLQLSTRWIPNSNRLPHLPRLKLTVEFQTTNATWHVPKQGHFWIWASSHAAAP